MENKQIQIPEGWEEKSLGDCSQIRMGETLIFKDLTGSGIPVYSANTENKPWGFTTLNRLEFPKGTIIIGARGSIGFPRIPIFNHFTSTQTTIALTPNFNFNPEYIFYKLKELDFSEITSQQAIPMLTTALTSKIKFLLPKSTTEQKKIAEILSKVDTAIEQTQSLIAKYQRIKTGLMQDLLTKGIDENGNIRSEETHEFKDSKLGRIPKEWDCFSLAEIYDLKSGITPLRRIKKYFSYEGYNWVKTLDLNESHLYNTEEKVTKFALENTSLRLMPVNSILIAMYGGWEQIGRTSILKKEAGTNQAVTCLYNPNRKMNSDFVQLILQQYRYKWKQFAVSTRKDPNITKSDISNFHIVFPKNVIEQNLIANKILKNKQYSFELSLEFSKLQSTKTALMQDLLSGKKRVISLIKENAL